MYRYLIHYTFPRGNGAVELTLPAPIRSMDDVNWVRDEAMKYTGIPDLMIASFSKFDEAGR